MYKRDRKNEEFNILGCPDDLLGQKKNFVKYRRFVKKQQKILLYLCSDNKTKVCFLNLNGKYAVKTTELLGGLSVPKNSVLIVTLGKIRNHIEFVYVLVLPNYS